MTTFYLTDTLTLYKTIYTMDPTSAEIQQNSLKTISVREFKDYKHSDEDPQRYKFGDEITRENFQLFWQSFYVVAHLLRANEIVTRLWNEK